MEGSGGEQIFMRTVGMRRRVIFFFELNLSISFCGAPSEYNLEFDKAER